MVYRTLAPTWYEALVFDTSLRDMATHLEIECFDYDLSSQDDSLGSFALDLSNLRIGDFRSRWCPLSGGGGGGGVSSSSSSMTANPKPEVHLEYALVQKRKMGASASGHLSIQLLRAERLRVQRPQHAAASSMSLPQLNPYVRVSFEDRVCRSRVITDSKEPDFRGSVEGGAVQGRRGDSVFEFLCDDPPKGRVELQVFSYEMMASDVLIGVASVDIAEKSADVPTELCLLLIPPSALDPALVMSEQAVKTSGRLYVSIDFVRNAQQGLYVIVGGAKGQSKEHHDAIPLWRPLLSAAEAAAMRRQVLMHT